MPPTISWWSCSNLDDVGQCYDLALGEPDRIGVTLGRHINDEVTSFYSNSPSDSWSSTAGAGRVIDVDTWQTEEVTFARACGAMTGCG